LIINSTVPRVRNVALHGKHMEDKSVIDFSTEKKKFADFISQ
jgi:hypothetical protein